VTDISGIPSIHAEDHPVASAFRYVAGIATVIAGAVGMLAALYLWYSGDDLPDPLDNWLLMPTLSKIAFTMAAAAATGGGILFLRGAAAGTPICSGTWAAVAALSARPGIRFNYSESVVPVIDFPANGGSSVTVVIFIVSAAMSICTHGYSGVTRHSHTKLAATLGETLTSAFLLVCGVVAAVTFQVDSTRLGSVVVARALLPLTVASIILQGIGLGVLGGWIAARAVAILIFFALAVTALMPDLLFDKVAVPAPLFWVPVCAVAAISLFIPRQLAHHAPGETAAGR
jgi:hypothetical protein